MPIACPPSPADPMLSRTPRLLDLVDAACDVGPLLDRAAELSELSGTKEAGRWHALRSDAAAVSSRLAARGTIPGHLVVGPSDPPVVVERSLVALSRHVDRLYAGLLTGRAAWENSTTADA